jgi:hypothetical protein
MLLLMTLAYSQTSKQEIEKIAKEQSDGILTSAQLGTKTVYNDGKDIVSTVYKDAKSLSPKISKGINEIAKGLKIGAEYVWQILVKQQKVWSICYLLFTIFSLINWYLFYRRNIETKINKEVGKRNVQVFVDNPEFDQTYYDQYKRYINSDYQSERKYTEALPFKRKILTIVEEDCYVATPTKEEVFKGFKYIHFSICITLSVFSAYHFGDMLTGFINPEYGAMRDILFVAIKLK